jgi:hypothetical protein
MTMNTRTAAPLVVRSQAEVDAVVARIRRRLNNPLVKAYFWVAIRLERVMGRG